MTTQLIFREVTCTGLSVGIWVNKTLWRKLPQNSQSIQKGDSQTNNFISVEYVMEDSRNTLGLANKGTYPLFEDFRKDTVPNAGFKI